jgi:hypothetical protein
LRSEAYTGSELNEQLTEQARAFLNDPSRNRVEPNSGIVYLSSIFKWFGEDFGANEKDILKAIAVYWPAAIQRAPEAKPFKIRYLEYDWRLNDRTR